MGGFSDGDLVWCPSKKKGETMWPGVIAQTTDAADQSKSLVCLIKSEHRHLDDIRQSKEFRVERRSLYLFDPASASKYAPESGKSCPSVSRVQFDKVVVLATMLFEERKKRVQEAYQLAVEKATRRASDFSTSNSDANPPVELAAGAHLFFWIPGMIAGRPEAEMHARVLSVYHPSRYEESQIPLELDSGHVLTMDDSVKMLKPVETKLMPLRKFCLKTSSVRGARMADIICQSVQDQFDQLKAENPAYSSMFRDPFGSTRRQVEIGKQEAKDLDFNGGKRAKKKKKKMKYEYQRPRSPKRQVVPSDRAGWMPSCPDSEEDDDNRMKYIPMLSVPNRPESQTPSRSSQPLPTPTRSNRPEVANSDSDGGQDQRRARLAACRLPIPDDKSRSESQTPSRSSQRLPTATRSEKPEVSDSDSDGGQDGRLARFTSCRPSIPDNKNTTIISSRKACVAVGRDCGDPDNGGGAPAAATKLTFIENSSTGIRSRASISPTPSKPNCSDPDRGGIGGNKRRTSGSNKKRKKSNEISKSKNLQQTGIKAYMTADRKESLISPNFKRLKEGDTRVHDLSEACSNAGDSIGNTVDAEEGYSRRTPSMREKIELVNDANDSDSELDVPLKTRCQNKTRASQQ